MPEPTKIAEWSGARGWTITNAADLSGYSVSHLSLIANGKRSASPRTKVRISRALGCRVADLFPAPGGNTGTAGAPETARPPV